MAEERENRTPLLHHNSASEIQTDTEQHEITSAVVLLEAHRHASSTSSTPLTSSSPPKIQRLDSLDVFRGLTIALMILVDDAGGAIPAINHSPWFGVTIADFVMPAFLFIVGVSVGLVFQKVPSKSAATKKVIIRTVKLFLLGIFLQGGFFHGRGKLTYGVDVERIRWLGVLQLRGIEGSIVQLKPDVYRTLLSVEVPVLLQARISIGYLLASISEIWLVNKVMVDSTLSLLRRYYFQWMVTALLCVLYTSLLYGLYVPSWKYDFQGMNSTLSPSIHQVQCGVRASLDPPCNAVGYIDRLLFGVNHLYQHPVYRRVQECSESSPDYGSLPPNAPDWCLAPFDPEGILSSLTAAITCFVGLHFGHIIAHFKDHMRRIIMWSISATPLLVLGYVILALGMPLSKPLYTLTYMCVTAGASGFIFTLIYYLVDATRITRPMALLQWMGMNAFLIYALAACEIFPILLQGFYWGSPDNNLVDGTESFLQNVFGSKSRGTLAFVILEIVFWGLFAGLLHRKSMYVRL